MDERSWIPAGRRVGLFLISSQVFKWTERISKMVHSLNSLNLSSVESDVTSVEAWRKTIARSPSWDGFLWARNTAIFRSSSRPSCVYTAKGKIRHGAQDFLVSPFQPPPAVLDALFFQGMGWRIWNPHGLREGPHGKAAACHTVQTDRSCWHGAPVPKSFSLFISDSFHFHVTFIHGNVRVPPQCHHPPPPPKKKG